MLKPEKEAKLKSLLQVIPEGALRQLRQAFVFGAEADPDGMPYERLIWLVEDAARLRDIVLDPSDPAEQTVPENPGSELPAQDAPQADGTDGLTPDAIQEDTRDEEDPAVAEIVPSDFDADDETPAGEEVAAEASLPEAGEPAGQADTAPDASADPEDVEEVTEAHAEAGETAAPAPVFEPPRNAMHAFFLPFAPLIIDPVKYLPRVDGYICSTSLPAIWRLLNEETSGAVIRDAWVKAELVSEPQEPAFYRQITSEMHAAARVVMDDLTTRSREDPALRRTLTSRLGSKAVLDDFAEFKVLLPFAENFQTVFERLVPEIDRFGEDDVRQLAEEIFAAGGISPALPGYLQLAILAHLPDPAKGLRLYAALRDVEAKSDKGKAETSLIADHLIAILDAESLWLEQKALSDAADPDLHVAFDGFCSLLAGLTRESGEAGQTLLDKRLLPATTRGGQVFAQLVKKALETVHKVLPLDINDGEGTTGEEGLKPDIGWLYREAGTEILIERAEQAALLLTGAEEMAVALGKLPLLRRSLKRAREELSGYADQLIPMISRSTGEKRLQAMRLSEHVVRLSRQLLGDDRADALKAAAEEAARAA